MGPRSIDRGNAVSLRVGISRELASMGPRSIDRGNRTNQMDVQDFDMLQWGRDLLIAEMNPLIVEAMIGMPASMGPRSIDRGNLMPTARHTPISPSFNGAAIY